jgi:hypothetical protein
MIARLQRLPDGRRLFFPLVFGTLVIAAALGRLSSVPALAAMAAGLGALVLLVRPQLGSRAAGGGCIPRAV